MLAAGRLFTTTVATAANAAVAHPDRCESNTAGPDQARPSVPSATAAPNRPGQHRHTQHRPDPASFNRPRADPDAGRHDADDEHRQRRRAHDDHQDGRGDDSGQAEAEHRPRRSLGFRRRPSQRTPLADRHHGRGDARAPSHGSHIRAANWPPVRCRWPSTIRLVRFEPGSSSEPALDSSRQP